jgi:RNA polymerase sigma factor (sigma-70 family)
MNEVVRHLRSAVLLREGAGLTDGQLLECFVSRRDEAALEALVRRHAPMVWGVCRRVLGSYHDAEDAFQATFLVLVRKAAAVTPRDMVANWLYGVAQQTARKARATAARRRARENPAAEMPEPAAVQPDLWAGVQPLLDQELSQLPGPYRAAIVLCDLEGKTRKEAARQLGLPEGTIGSRLARGRALLAKRLTRHGLGVPGGVLAALLAQQAASAGAPASTLSATINTATSFAAGRAGAAGLISAKVAALTEGVLQAMLLAKLKAATAVLLVLGLVTLAGGLLAAGQADGRQGRADAPAQAAAPPPHPPGSAAPPKQATIDRAQLLEQVELLKAVVRFYRKRVQTLEEEVSNLKQKRPVAGRSADGRSAYVKIEVKGTLTRQENGYAVQTQDAVFPDVKVLVHLERSEDKNRELDSHLKSLEGKVVVVTGLLDCRRIDGRGRRIDLRLASAAQVQASGQPGTKPKRAKADKAGEEAK